MQLILTYIFILFSTSYPIDLAGQATLAGAWSGYTTQDGTGVYSQQYHFELYLHQKGNKVWGRSYSKEGQIYSEMALEGVFENGIFHFQETKIIKFEAKTGMEWCVKQGKLTLSIEAGTSTLQGTWVGNTSFSDCIPGKVFLKKIKIRA